MSMSKKRKNLQAKLRRKYNYQTNTNYDITEEMRNDQN